MKSHGLLRRLFLIAILLLGTTLVTRADSVLSGSGTVSITTAAGVTENFNTLSNGATATDVLPTGWYLLESGAGAVGGALDGKYVSGTGTSATGNVYSFGAAASTERALGSVGSGTVNLMRYGAKFVNNTGFVLTALTLSYTGEMWRRGTSTVAQGEGLTFAYSVDQSATLATGTFTNVAALNFVSPGDSCSATTLTPTDGNGTAACRVAISSTISGLTIPDGQTFFIRWTDVDTGGSDDGMSIDDVSLSVTTSTISINPTATGTASSPVNPGGSITLSGTITKGQNPTSISHTVVCNLTAIGGSATQALNVVNTTFSYTTGIPANQPLGPTSFACSVTDDQARASLFTINTLVLLPLNPTCGTSATPIHSIQGVADTSAFVGQIVDVEGVVVGPFQGASGLNGFYLEEPDATQDGNAATSEGLFVFSNAVPVTAGDRVRFRGTVAEFPSATGALVSNLTELGTITSGQVCSTGNPPPTPTTVSLPLASVSDFERYEGMLVQFTQQLVVTGSFSLGQFGQIDLAPSVLFNPTQTVANVPTWTAAADLNARSKIALDDASTLSNANLNGGGVAPYPAPGLSAANTLRVGALVNATSGAPTPLVGILDDRFGSYRIQPTAPLTFSNAPNPRPNTVAISAALGGRFKVASANVLNFFTTLGSRGAATAQELVNQRAKVIASLSKLNADIYGLSEVQNFANGNTSGVTYTNSAVSDLTTNLATATGRNYQFIDTLNAANVVGGDITQNGTDAIRNVIIYDASRVTPVGLAALYYQNDSNRPSLAQTFKPATGLKTATQTFTVVVNHFRSKGSACGGVSDDPLQGNCNGLRTLMASNVQTWLAGNPTADPAGINRRYLLIGDFNAYLGEDPIQSFVGGSSYKNLIQLLIGPGAYSYNFGSTSGYLDHAIVNTALLPLIKSIAELHINADEPAALEALDSNLKSATAQAAYFAPDEFAASDHDPFLIALNPLPGDLNDDGVVDTTDRNMLIAATGKPASQVDRRMDYDRDGMITGLDYYRGWYPYFLAFNQP